MNKMHNKTMEDGSVVNSQLVYDGVQFIKELRELQKIYFLYFLL